MPRYLNYYSRRHFIGGGLTIALGVVILVITLFAGGSSPKGWIARNYTKERVDTFRSADRPLKTADRIATKFKPEDRVIDATGVYLRYRNVIVGVRPVGSGSRITVDNPARGYGRYHTSLSGRWGGPGGSASTFRGGGPGEGK